MIKLPKKINTIIKTLESSSFRAYAAGECVRQSILGQSPLDWDIITNASSSDLEKLFPGASALNKRGVMRLDYTSEDESEIIADIIPLKKEEDFVKSAESFLKTLDFTVNAIGDNPSEKLCDPCDARGDMSKKLIKATGNASEQLVKDPIRILRAMRLAAEMGYDLTKDLHAAILENRDKLKNVPYSDIREEFELLLQAPDAGKGLKMIAATEVLPYILGDGVNHLTRRQNNDFLEYCENVHKIKPILLSRLGLLLICFDRRKGLKMLEILGYEGEEQQHLTDSLTLMEKLYFLKDEKSLKKFLGSVGLERYNYVNTVAKAQRIVYDFPETRIVGRIELLKIIKSKGDPIFVEDLAIDAEDLIEAGIATPENAGRLLQMLLDIVHKKPARNTKQALLSEAKRLSKNKFAMLTRKVEWLR